MIVVLAIGTLGAYAYFTTDVRTASGNIKSGTLNLLVAGAAPSQDCSALTFSGSTSLWMYDNLAPGDVVNGRLCMKNTGSIDIAQVTFAWSGVPLDLANNLFVTHVVNSQTGDEIAGYMAYDTNGDHNLSLSELWNGGGTGVDEYWVGGIPVFLPTTAPVQWVDYTFQFNPAAGNTLQGLTTNYNLAITGYQHPQY